MTTSPIPVPVCGQPAAYRQDASLWRDQALMLLGDPISAQERALNIRIALKRDEPTKESYDNFITYVLGKTSSWLACLHSGVCV